MRVRKLGQLPGAVPPVSATQMASHLRLACCGEDEELDAATAALVARLTGTATAAAADRLQRTLVPTRYQLTLDSFPTAIELSYPPVLTVESVQYVDVYGDLQTLDPQDYTLDNVSEPGYLVPAFGRAWPATQCHINTVQVVYTAGYPAGTVPEPVQQWIMLAAGDLSEQTSRSSDKPAVPQSFADALLDTYKVVVI